MQFMAVKKEETSKEHKKKHLKLSCRASEELEEKKREHCEEEKELIYKEHEEKVRRDEIEEEMERY